MGAGGLMSGFAEGLQSSMAMRERMRRLDMQDSREGEKIDLLRQAQERLDAKEARDAQKQQTAATRDRFLGPIAGIEKNPMGAAVTPQVADLHAFADRYAAAPALKDVPDYDPATGKGGVGLEDLGRVKEGIDTLADPTRERIASIFRAVNRENKIEPVQIRVGGQERVANTNAASRERVAATNAASRERVADKKGAAALSKANQLTPKQQEAIAAFDSATGRLDEYEKLLDSYKGSLGPGTEAAHTAAGWVDAVGRPLGFDPAQDPDYSRLVSLGGEHLMSALKSHLQRVTNWELGYGKKDLYPGPHQERETQKALIADLRARAARDRAAALGLYGSQGKDTSTVPNPNAPRPPAPPEGPTGPTGPSATAAVKYWDTDRNTYRFLDPSKVMAVDPQGRRYRRAQVDLEQDAGDSPEE